MIGFPGELSKIFQLLIDDEIVIISGAYGGALRLC
jgi:hypothetical protein